MSPLQQNMGTPVRQDARNPAQQDARNPAQQERPATMGRMRRAWTWVWTITVALLVVGALGVLDPSRDEPEKVTRAAMGRWAETERVRVRVDSVERAAAVKDRYTDETITVPGAELVQFTVNVEWLRKKEGILDPFTLRIGDDTYTLAPEMRQVPEMDPGYVVTGQVGFWVPHDRIDDGVLVLHSTQSLYGGITGEVVHVAWSDPTPIPLAGTKSPMVEAR
ncbi:hypothetical protein [Propioniferax innocua]|uniref:DUF4352 domain-containing protein n=1 Tax=Propioniferax innocua TaxID=1753 RepID=A0A542ZBZ2_9ACTN|nr:hypothetical protein [Propioniferax innocua]TQL57854.1 hypothetical protein FB460_1699 [Propioniferax innocua]